MADVPDKEAKIKLNKKGNAVKKRAKNVEEWHKTKQKRLRIAGKEYINANGKLVQAKQPGPDCNCRRKCYARIPEDVRLKTFQGFYSMKNHDEQNAYLFGLMRQIDVKRKRIKTSSRRTCTFEYFVRVKGKETQVCQTAFKNIHAITERKVRVLCKKMDDGVMFPCDNRGKNSHRRAGEIRLPSATVEQIKNHIYSIVHTHRLKDFIRLDKVAGLEINISKMWKDYIKSFDPENLEFTYPKSKRTSDSVENNRSQNNGHEESFSEVNYAQGQLVSISENYFSQPQYPTNQVSTSSYYPSQLILQPPQAVRGAQATAYIFVQTKQEPTPDQLPPQNYLQSEPQDPLAMQLKKEKKSNKGPIVKQWRYSNMFHELINGAVLAAIKTRLAMYYAESDASKKKVKKVENVQVQTQPQVGHQPLPQNSSTPQHTVTIYT